MNNHIALLFYFPAAFALAWIVGFSTISQPVRWALWGPNPQAAASFFRGFVVNLLECPGCFGVWTGAIVGLMAPELAPLTDPVIRPLSALALALCTCCFNIGLASTIKLIDLRPGGNPKDEVAESLKSFFAKAGQQSEEDLELRREALEAMKGRPSVRAIGVTYELPDAELHRLATHLQVFYGALNDHERASFDLLFQGLVDGDRNLTQRFYAAIQHIEVLSSVAKKLKVEA